MFSLEKRVYVCIDLKSFYASVECVERDLDPLVTNLVVADKSRTLKTVCLAVTPPLIEYNSALTKLQRAPKNCISRPILIADTQQAIA